MNTLKAIQTSFLPTKHAFLHSGKLPNKNIKFTTCCKSNNAESGSESSSPEGDKKKQELLVKIAMLQTQKVRLTDYLDERSAYLSEFAEKANDEFNEIGENALKELDEAENRIMEKLELNMQSFEENAELNKLVIEENEKKVGDFEDQIDKDRNEGLFFKNLGQKKPVDQVKAKEEARKVKEVTRKSAGSNTRRNFYLALLGLTFVAVADSLFSNPSDWIKPAVLGLISVALLSQFIYEQSLSSKTERTDQEDEQK
ncbi:uncharacterized protein LOC113321510 [Papaver somniferum]|uniref:uncharacterized protein LOC113321510 n=1 Tax=Papaver somniferum TaxID=3469 RepID=UPI000E6FAA47|nr:uncharacterized protein LOC113321510 [Papaver somniferum]